MPDTPEEVTLSPEEENVLNVLQALENAGGVPEGSTEELREIFLELAEEE